MRRCAAPTRCREREGALTLANQTLARSSGLLAQGYVSQSQVDADTSAQIAASGACSSAQVAAAQARLQTVAARSQATASSEQGVAQTAAGSASLSSAAASRSTAAAAQSAVDVAQAHVRSAQLDVDHTIITSPVDGTVDLPRRLGRADGRGLVLDADAVHDRERPEQDGSRPRRRRTRYRLGQSRAEHVDFSVLAYPGQTFHGTISQVRMNATVVSNVVTYTAVVLVDNTDGRLRPGMTANASIHVGQSAANALVVPVAALSWRPPAELRPASAKSTRSGRHSASSAPGASAASPWGNTGSSGAGALVAGSKARLFVQAAGGALRAVPVTVSLVSGARRPSSRRRARTSPKAMPSSSPAARPPTASSSTASSPAALGSAPRPPRSGGAGRGH